MESYVCICHCHCCMQVISFLLVSDSFTFETTNDICAFSLNYTLLLFHNGIYCVPCSTNSIQLNTCAEVSAFTPPTTHPPLQSRTYQPTQSQPQQHICSSRLLLDAVGMLSSCRCVRILVGLFHTRVVLFEVKQHEATALAVIVLWNYLCVHLRDNRHHTMFHFSVFFCRSVLHSTRHKRYSNSLKSKRLLKLNGFPTSAYVVVTVVDNAFISK